MSIEMTFKDVCEAIKKKEPKLLASVDQLLGLALVCSPALFGTAGFALLPLLSVKNELVKLGKNVFDAVTGREDSDFIARQQRMQIAYGLICYTAFFEALDRQLPDALREKFKLLSPEKIAVVQHAHKEVAVAVLPEGASGVEAINFATLSISFPHPSESMDEQEQRQLLLYQRMAEGFAELVARLAVWEEAEGRERDQVLDVLLKIPPVAVKCFEGQYFELCRRFEDFAVWANLQEHKNTKALIGELSGFVRSYVNLTKSRDDAMDIGFAKLGKTVQTIPEILKLAQATDIVDGLTKNYRARLDEPIIEDKIETEEGKPRLYFPKISEAFVPQSFRVLRQSSKAKHLEAEVTWKDLDRRDDLGAFLLSFLSSPYSTESPLLILGHPGSGKSLLTKLLSARLMSKHYTVFRVPLREVNSEAAIVNQIEEQIGRITAVHVDSWAKVSGAFKNNPPLVILDGYDELLQASGKVFSSYLKDVQTFQKNEAEQGRPIRAIVTSRITLIDKATVPQGSTIIRLLEFDQIQREKWISIWNKANEDYFLRSRVHPFRLPDRDDNDSAKVLSLAEQPLLLLMLALYDSEDNKLRDSKTLDRTALYESLLRRFVERERVKDHNFEDLLKKEKERQLNLDMRRLGVAAVGMYNRRQLHILSAELSDDLRFFDLERESNVAAGRALTQADLLLGSFFFVHKSTALQKAGVAEGHEEMTAFEFLHNTFGEFLTADFIIREAFVEVEALRALKSNEALRASLDRQLGEADGLSRAWFASLVYTPLFTRPVVLEMIREWISHVLKSRKLSRKDFLALLDEIVLSQLRRLLTKREMPSIMQKDAAQEGYRPRFGDHPLLGHVAIYSMNLIILRAIVGDGPFTFDESQIAAHEDGSRSWDQLTHVWRSWFSIDNLNGITAVLSAERSNSTILVRAKDSLAASSSHNRLETFRDVSSSLADNIGFGLAGLLLYDPSREDDSELEFLDRHLQAEHLDLDVEIAIKRLFRCEFTVDSESIDEVLSIATDALIAALRRGRASDFTLIVASLGRCLEAAPIGWFQRSRDRLALSSQRHSDVHAPWHPELLIEIAERNSTAAIELLTIVRKWGGPKWARNFSRYFPRILFPRRPFFHEMDQNLEALFTISQIIKDLNIETERSFVRFSEDLLRDLPEEQIDRACERYPDRAFGFLDSLMERKESGWMEREGVRMFRKAFDTISFADLVVHSPISVSSAIRLIRYYEDKGRADRAAESLELLLEEKGASSLLAKQLAVDTLPELRWLAEVSGSRRLKEFLETR